MKPPALSEPRMEILPEKKLIGKRLTMTLAENRTVELWRSFMTHRKEIKNAMTSDLFSVQVYEPSFDFDNFDPYASFEKWAAMQVSDDSELPPGMERLCLEEGTYAVFFYKGAASGGGGDVPVYIWNLASWFRTQPGQQATLRTIG